MSDLWPDDVDHPTRDWGILLPLYVPVVFVLLLLAAVFVFHYVVGFSLLPTVVAVMGTPLVLLLLALVLLLRSLRRFRAASQRQQKRTDALDRLRESAQDHPELVVLVETVQAIQDAQNEFESEMQVMQGVTSLWSGIALNATFFLLGVAAPYFLKVLGVPLP